MSNKSEQFKIKFEKIIGIWKHAGKVRKKLLLIFIEDIHHLYYLLHYNGKILLISNHAANKSFKGNMTNKKTQKHTLQSLTGSL